MTTRVLLITDTHLPKRAKVLPAALWGRIEAADLVVHAGDWVEVGLVREMRQRSRRLLAVYGNNDDALVRAELPEVATAVIDGVRLTVVHETGVASGRESRCDDRFPDSDLLVFGHSHIPWDSTTSHGLRLLNPGSPTDRRRQPQCTYMTLTLQNGTVSDVRLVPVERKVPTTATPPAQHPQ